MKDYYNSKCLVKYSRPINFCDWETIKTEMPVSEAMFYMKERMLPEMVIVEVYK